MQIDEKKLIQLAQEAQKNAYSPYSNFFVGAALLATTGEIYQGCNIESASYSPTICAERTAFFKAVSQGERSFVAIAVVGGYLDNKTQKKYCTPCGVCRQVMAEFCLPDFKIIIAKTQEDFFVKTLDELLPFAYSPKNLDK